MRHIRTSRKPFIVFAVVFALLLVACGDGDEGGASGSAPNVEFGSGAVPDTVPEDFPVPVSAVVSSTLVNRETGFTEMIFRLPTTVAATTAYYTQNLPIRGYTIDSSDGVAEGTWAIVFSGANLSGRIEFRPLPGDVSEAVFQLETGG